MGKKKYLEGMVIDPALYGDGPKNEELGGKNQEELDLNELAKLAPKKILKTRDKKEPKEKFGDGRQPK